MKNIALAIMVALLVSACSSGSTATELPQNVTSRFQGTFDNTTGSQSGTVTIDIVETAGTVTGNIIFESSGSNCLRNAPVTGNTTGFNLSLAADQAGQLFTTTTTTTSSSGSTSTTVRTSTSGRVGTTSSTSSSGSSESVVTTAEDVTGTLNMQFTITNGGANIGGTYVTDGNVCSNATGSGNMSLVRS